MKAHRLLCLVTSMFAAPNAYAACTPVFTAAGQTITIPTPSNLDTGHAVQDFRVTIRNDGDEDCTLLLGVGRDTDGADLRFPSYTLTGPGGPVPIVDESAAVSNRPSQVSIPVGTAVDMPVRYQVALSANWSTPVGTLTDRLSFFLLDGTSQQPVASHEVTLLFTMTPQIRIMLTGSSVSLGEVLDNAPTTSPPFGFRVQSTSDYTLRVESENRGTLLLQDGLASIPYEMTVGGTKLDLSGAGHLFGRTAPTAATGDVFPVVITIQPQDGRLAGRYQDRITLTATTL